MSINQILSMNVILKNLFEVLDSFKQGTFFQIKPTWKTKSYSLFDDENTNEIYGRLRQYHKSFRRDCWTSYELTMVNFLYAYKNVSWFLFKFSSWNLLVLIKYLFFSNSRNYLKKYPRFSWICGSATNYPPNN